MGKFLGEVIVKKEIKYNSHFILKVSATQQCGLV